MESVDTENISEELLIFHCSPTMAGLKTGNLFNCPLKNDRTFLDNIREINRRLIPRGVRLVPLKNMEQSVLVYMYRPDRLREDLGDSGARKILAEREYPIGEPEKCIVWLVRRLKDGEAFPHEIGLFLGYPPEDVDGFIRNGAAGQNASGYGRCTEMWKPRSVSLHSTKNAQGYIGRHFRNTVRLTGSLWAVLKSIIYDLHNNNTYMEILHKIIS